MILVIIGGGLVGYVVVVFVVQQGRNVLLIDKGLFGGICLNEGCILMKLLLESVNVFDKIKDVDYFGIEFLVGVILVDWSKMQN